MDTSTNGTAATGPDGLPLLPDIFSGKHFLLYGKYSAPQRRILNRFIVAYNGYGTECANDSCFCPSLFVVLSALYNDLIVSDVVLGSHKNKHRVLP